MGRDCCSALRRASPCPLLKEGVNNRGAPRSVMKEGLINVVEVRGHGRL